jgi:hypothetical protein
MNIEESFSNRGEQSGCDARTSSSIGAATVAAAIAKPWPSRRPSSTWSVQLCRIASCYGLSLPSTRTMVLETRSGFTSNAAALACNNSAIMPTNKAVWVNPAHILLMDKLRNRMVEVEVSLEGLQAMGPKAMGPEAKLVYEVILRRHQQQWLAIMRNSRCWVSKLQHMCALNSINIRRVFFYFFSPTAVLALHIFPFNFMRTTAYPGPGVGWMNVARPAGDQTDLPGNEDLPGSLRPYPLLFPAFLPFLMSHWYR